MATVALAPAPGTRVLDQPSRQRRRVLAVWALLFLNGAAYAGQSTLVHIPSSVGRVITQGALLLAAVFVLTVNRRGIFRPNAFMAVWTLLGLTTLAMSVRLVSFGTDYRAFRLLLAIGVAWLLTPWFGSRAGLLVGCHLRVLEIVMGLVVAGAVLDPGAAFPAGGRLSGVIWPMPATQVAHYAATLTALTVILWLCQIVDRRRALLVIPVGLSALLLSHTRTALFAMIAGLLVAGLSLFTSRRRVRRTFAVLVILVAAVGPVAGPAATAWLSRGQSSQELTQLTGRTKVWAELLASSRPETEVILGSGLSNDSFNGLPIDSSWLATYQDQGLVGDVLEATMLLILLVMAASRPRGPNRALALYLTVYCLIASFTETGVGLVSSYTLDLVLAAALVSGGPLRRTPNRGPLGG